MCVRSGIGKDVITLSTSLPAFLPVPMTLDNRCLGLPSNMAFWFALALKRSCRAYRFCSGERLPSVSEVRMGGRGADALRLAGGFRRWRF